MLQTCMPMFDLQLFWEDGDTPTDEIPSPDSTLPVQYHTDDLQQQHSTYTLNKYVTLEEEW